MPPASPELDAPLLLAPDFKEKIWGREHLDPLYPTAAPKAWWGPASSALRTSAASRRVGEAWLTGEKATFMTGSVSGLTLGEVFARSGAELCGSSWSADDFPFLAKFLFTSDWLSMQVHPDDDYAERHEHSRGKTEAWYVIEREDNARIALGLAAGTTRAALESACRAGRSREVAQSFRPEPGEAVFVPSRTAHALGPGLIVFELSETSDVTYRLDDYGRVDDRGRPRDLHLEPGLESVRTEAPAYRDLPSIQCQELFGSRRYVLACRYFAIEAIVLESRWIFPPPPDRVEALVVIGGQGRVETEQGWLAYAGGQTWLVPSRSQPYRLVPEETSRFLRLYVPDIDRDFRQPLAERGVAREAISRVAFED
jgi:mannose-6-phosphate isomerase